MKNAQKNASDPYIPDKVKDTQSGVSNAIENTNNKAPITATEYDVNQPATIDVMFVYTEQAKAWADTNIGGIEQAISTVVEESQLILDNSDTGVILRSVHMSQVDYTPSGSPSLDLDYVTGWKGTGLDPYGYMDEVHTWRDKYGADLVVLISNNFSSGTSGIAWLNGKLAAYGFSAVDVRYISSGNITVLHEIGHNFGCDHSRNQKYSAAPESGGIFEYSTGWRWTGNDSKSYCSVMTYNEMSKRVPLFSNPDILWSGVPTGSYEGQYAPADNARTIRETKHIVAGFRKEVNTGNNISITSLTASKKSPQPKGTTIRWTCSATGGIKKQYKFVMYDGSTIIATQAYSSKNYYDWTPTKTSSNYRVRVYVKEEGTDSSTAVSMLSDYYIINAPIAITSITANKSGPHPVGSTIRWTCNATGGNQKQYKFVLYDGSTIIDTKAYSSSNYYDWTPTESGSKYRVRVYVKENGAESSTAVSVLSDYYTINASIAITSITPNKSGPQPVGSTIRWTCNATGGNQKQYKFVLYNGSTIIDTKAYSSSNYYDWTPTKTSSNYRVRVYVKEEGTDSSTAVSMLSDYYIINTPISITSITANKVSPQPKGTTIRWTCSATGGIKKQYKFVMYDGSTIIATQAYSSKNYYDWTPTKTSSKYRVRVYVKENGAASSTAVSLLSEYYVISN